MKKFFAIILVMVLTLSLCACNNYVDEDGNAKEAENGEIVFEMVGEFTITKIDTSTYYVSSVGHRNKYTAVMKNDEYAVVVDISVQQYACWEVGDIVSGEIVSTYSSSYGRPMTDVTINGETYDVTWYGKY